MSEERPLPPDAEDIARWRENRRRYMMQTGRWRSLAVQKLGNFFDPTILQRIWSTTDDSMCPFRTNNEKRNSIYDVFPTATGGGKDLKPLALGVHWGLSQYRHSITVACNDSYVRYDWQKATLDATGTGISYRVVEPHFIGRTIASPYRPDVPIYLEELREYTNPEGKLEWVWEVWDCRDPQKPSFQVLNAGRDKDVTAQYLAALVGPGGAYERDPDGAMRKTRGFFPYTDKNGRPIFPYQKYASRVRNELYDPYSRNELVEGTLVVACLRTWFVGGLRDLAHPQRYGIDVDLPSAVGIKGGSKQNRVTLDASAILMFRAVGANPTISTLEPGMDPDKACTAIERFAMSLHEGDGLGGESNVNRGSGYMLVVAQGPLRKVQRQQEPACRQSDSGLLAGVSRMTNKYQGTDLPERPDEFTLAYHGVEPTLEERRAAIESVQAKTNLRLTTRRDAYIELNPMASPEEADRKLAEIEVEQAALAAVGIPQDGQRHEALDTTITDPSSGAPLRTSRGVSVDGPDGPNSEQSDQVLQNPDPKQPVQIAPAAVAPVIPLTSTDLAVVVTVNEVRAGLRLGPITDGHLTVAAYKAKYASVVAEAANAEAGTTADTPAPPAEPAT